MTGCFVWFLLIAGAVFVMVSLLRWFEQTADAMDQGEWSKLALLVVFPFAVWFYPSRYATGRPSAVPRHEPVRGFGKVPAMQRETAAPVEPTTLATTTSTSDQPPPGTPAEFMGMPTIPPKKPKAQVDPDKLAKLKQKMREQGMLDE